MHLHRVSDLDFSEVSRTDYDLAFFSSGYEHRCIHVPRKLQQDRLKRIEVLGFADLSESAARIEHDNFYSTSWMKKVGSVSGQDDSELFRLLRKIRRTRSGRTIRILVDYTSMSRLWYAAIINWARNVRLDGELQVDFTYAVGDHAEYVTPRVINDILAIPGCEGGAMRTAKSVAVFGLGFEGDAALCVLDRLESDIVYAYMASAIGYPAYKGIVNRKNKELIEKHAQLVLELPVDSVETTFQYLAELIAPHRSDSDITFIPMGPKPHVLAAILLAVRFQEIACLHVSVERPRPEAVDAIGNIASTRVVFVAEPNAIT